MAAPVKRQDNRVTSVKSGSGEVRRLKQCFIAHRTQLLQITTNLLLIFYRFNRAGNKSGYSKNVLRQLDKGNPTERWVRKASGLRVMFTYDSRAASMQHANDMAPAMSVAVTRELLLLTPLKLLDHRSIANFGDHVDPRRSST
jgi:hypothetical protein